MIELAKKLDFSPELIEELNILLLKEEDKVKRVAKKCISSGFYHLIGKSHMFNLAVILKLAVDVKIKYDQLGIDEKIYYDTMSDIKIWCEKNENKGLKNYNWLKNHVKFEVFRLGRLQFGFYKCNNKSLFYNKLPFRYGDNLILLHVPEGEKLDFEKCVCSFKQADEFFEKYFPEYDYNYYFAPTWLLYDGNKDFMSNDSNIIKFMTLFTNYYNIRYGATAIKRIYGKRKIFKKSYSEKTSLQKKAKEYMLQGNKLGVGFCAREKEKRN